MLASVRNRQCGARNVVSTKRADSMLFSVFVHLWRAFMTSQHPNFPFSQFVEFVVDPRHQANLVVALQERFEGFTRTYPGFIRASVHVSEDRQRVLSHVLWQSKEDCEAAVANSEQGEGDVWGLIRAYQTKAITFNAYEQVGEIVGRR